MQDVDFRSIFGERKIWGFFRKSPHFLPQIQQYYFHPIILTENLMPVEHKMFKIYHEINCSSEINSFIFFFLILASLNLLAGNP